MKKKICIFLFFALLFSYSACTYAQVQSTTSSDSISLQTPSAILMESTTGTILFEKNAHDKMRPASITKIMTLILIFEALENGSIHKNDIVTVSEHAASMGGSQVFLETGEEQTVDDLLKCISVASANDACVAMAEYICGSEEAFVAKMNEKAKLLQMNDTCFQNCCGLEAQNHLTSAYDIALMSRELITKYPDIYNYCSIWMDTIYHTTKKGTSEFGLTNTNKLLRYYSYTTGLKTGYTSQSKYCISATAKKDDLSLIAVVMAEDSSSIRNKEAVTLFNYGFSNYRKYIDESLNSMPPIIVHHGTEQEVPIHVTSTFETIIPSETDKNSIEKELQIPEAITAPVKLGQPLGKLVYKLNGTPIGSVDIISCKEIPSLTYHITFTQMLSYFFMIT